MTSEGLGEMFEGDSADTCAGKFPLVSMGGRAEGLTCADPGAWTPIGASGNVKDCFSSLHWNSTFTMCTFSIKYFKFFCFIPPISPVGYSSQRFHGNSYQGITDY